MRRTPLLLFVFLAWTSIGAPPRLVAADEPGERALRVEQWLNAVLHHTPGAADAAVLEVSSWSNNHLAILRTDESVLFQLMRNPRLVSFQLSSQEVVDCQTCPASETAQPRKMQPPRTIRYTNLDLHRLKVLACAAAGTLTDPTCIELRAPKEIDAELSRLAALAAAALDRGDNNYVLRHGALLQADAAMLASNLLAPLNAGGPDSQPIRVHIVDGEPTRVGLGEVHWEIARLLLDAVRPKRDAMVNLWYRATAAWMQSREQYNNLHLAHARELFPNDADIAFLSGCERETDAGPAMQSVARSAVLPAGVTLGIASERSALRDAEGFFRRALALNPRLVEGRVRLGHVLLAQGKAQDAADELRPAVASTAEPLLQYFGSMFLGAAEEALGHLPAARDSYARAAALYPRAQSPYLALSALATRRGDRAEALTEIRRVFDLRRNSDERDEPWWAYYDVAGRNADALLEQLWRPFLEAQP
jgi:tetratricopeptide (TPR) repeat protein